MIDSTSFARPLLAQLTLTARLRTAFAAWRQRRRSRRELRALDEHMLSDIGLTRGQVEVEASRVFWRV